MSRNGTSLLPPDFTVETLDQLLQDANARATFLQAQIQQFETRYGTSLASLEARLERGEGSEHPDWEDSMEWRAAVEALERAQIMRSLLIWLLNSSAPSPAS